MAGEAARGRPSGLPPGERRPLVRAACISASAVAASLSPLEGRSAASLLSSPSEPTRPNYSPAQQDKSIYLAELASRSVLASWRAGELESWLRVAAGTEPSTLYWHEMEPRSSEGPRGGRSGCAARRWQLRAGANKQGIPGGLLPPAGGLRAASPPSWRTRRRWRIGKLASRDSRTDRQQNGFAGPPGLRALTAREGAVEADGGQPRLGLRAATGLPGCQAADSARRDGRAPPDSGQSGAGSARYSYVGAQKIMSAHYYCCCRPDLGFPLLLNIESSGPIKPIKLSAALCERARRVCCECDSEF